MIEDPIAMDELKELGYFATPVTFINDEAVVGFNVNKFKDLLGLD